MGRVNGREKADEAFGIPGILDLLETAPKSLSNCFYAVVATGKLGISSNMSADSTPISAQQFALAIQDLPIENIYSKAHEIRNSISHLERSNQQLQSYIDSIKTDSSLLEATRQEGDKDCSDAIHENAVVINRQQERMELLKQEVERRGGRWHEADNGAKVNGSPEGSAPNGEAPATSRGTGGRLTDEELRRQMMERIVEDDNNEDEGMHL
ncbi:hypothetical protein H2202_010727 [Exophiala xenobiotica]|nr:hypothetical protein H2202_010727 [Exophiala xenobiotica]